MDSIDYYNKYAVKVFEDTVNEDMGEIRQEFLDLLEEGDTILDLGCGSGRDSLMFYDLGYDVTPLDGSEEMCKLAQIHTDLDVLHMDFDELDFDEAFDGVWACASLVHVPKAEMPGILGKIAAALTDKGILYMSLKMGDFEGFRGERYFSDYTEDSAAGLLRNNGRFEPVRIWTTDDVRSAHAGGRWVNVLARKI